MKYTHTSACLWACVSLGAMLAACSPTSAPTAVPKHAPAATPAAARANAQRPVASTPDSTKTSATTTETWILPGTLGPLTTRAELETRFGKDNVQDSSVPGVEGEGSTPALTLFPHDAAQRLWLVLDSEQPDNRDAPIHELRVQDPQSRWRDAQGLHIGMSLAELVQRNDAPISFYGLDWDYGGTVQDWHGGKLANGVGNAVFHRVTLGARRGANTAPLPTGDGSFRSDDPRFPTIGKNLVVTELGISWPQEGR